VLDVIKGFRDFILRGNVVDLAVAVVIGTAFGLVVAAFVKDLITPLVAAIFGKPDFSSLTFTINGSTFRYGDFINAVIAFLLVATAIYFVVVVPMNKLAEVRARKEVAATRECPHCLTEIPNKATRCSACTSDVPMAA
jgi:large conductance mechanosensitive channel